ncbi:MAG: hypothetical protein V4663_05080 [Bacteroidota bacterium]
MKEIQRYIQDSFGLPIKFTKFPEAQLRELPLYLKAGYELEEAHLARLKLIFARPKLQEYTPGQLEKQRKMLAEHLKAIIIFVLDEIEPYIRKRMIGAGVAFLEVGKQLYIPELLLELNDLKKQHLNEESRKSHLSISTQVAVLYHLQVGSIEELPLISLAKLFDTNAMAISRIVKELDQQEVIIIEGTKEKSIRFKAKGNRQIWESVNPMMVSPVRKIYYTDHPLDVEPKVIRCFDTALAEYSHLSPGRQPAYAVSRFDFNALAEKIELHSHPSGNFRLEEWAYDASKLSGKNIVDPLSLYLSMRDQDDERIKMALEHMINELKW